MELYRKGDRGWMVKRIQQTLTNAGYGVVADGIFGEITHEAVKAFQRSNGLVDDGIVGMKTMALLLPAATGLKKSKRRIDLILVHCTATPEGRDKTVEQIRQEHMTPKPRGNGWSDIGYHYVIYRDGTIHEGRDVNIMGAHCEGYNAHSIGVVYVGGVENRPGVPYKELKPKDTRTEAQKMALLSLLLDLRKIYPNAKIAGHRDYDKKGKACPSFDARAEYSKI